jgi:hypothetical protein
VRYPLDKVVNVRQMGLEVGRNDRRAGPVWCTVCVLGA